MNLTVYEVLRGFHEMQDDVKKLFAYLNGRVNTLNLCTLNIMYYSRLNYAQFQYPNIVTVFLSSILDEFYFDDGTLTKRDRVLTVLALTMTHELFHADQCVDPLSYKKDPSYSSNVEYAAEYNAEKFCLSHKRELENLLGFRYSLTGKITSPYGEYNKLTIGDYYGNLLLGTFRCTEIYDEFTECFTSDEYQEIWVMVSFKGQDYNPVMVKHAGKPVTDPSIMGDFASMLSNVRRGIAACNYTMHMSLRSAPNAYVFHVSVDEISYCPFIFEY